MGVLLGSFSQAADKTVANTTVETSLLNLIQQSNILIPEFMEQGKTFRFRQTGIRSRQNGNETYRIKLNSTTILIANQILLGAGNNDGWDIDLLLQITSSGVNGSAGGLARIFNWSNGSLTPLIALTPVIINTTIRQTFDFTIQWSIANAGNSITSKHCSIYN